MSSSNQLASIESVEIELPVRKIDAVRRCLNCGQRTTHPKGERLLEKCVCGEREDFEFAGALSGIIAGTNKRLTQYLAGQRLYSRKAQPNQLLDMLLTGISVRRGDGLFSDEFCVICQDWAHGVSHCPCACHPAREYLKEL